MNRFLLLFLFLTASTAAAQKHPYLFFPSSRLEVLKKRIASDTAIASYWRTIRQEADAALKGGDARARVDHLSLAYLLTGEPSYAGKVREVLLNLCSKPSWSNAEMLERKPAWTSDLKTAENCRIVALGFDAVYETLSKEDRKTIVDGLVRMGIRPALDNWVLGETRFHTLNSMGHNWWSACVGMAGVASLAILGDYPEAANWVETVSKASEEWYRFNGDELHFKPRTMDRNGGMYESVNYASFGLSEYLFFRLAYTNTFPKKTLPDLPGLAKFPDWFLHVGYPRDGILYSLNFGDGNLAVTGERPVKLLEALGYRHPNHLWYLNQITRGQHREGLSPDTPLGLVYLPDMQPAPRVPDLPTSALFPDMNWASMRSSWEKNATLLGVKSGYTWNHSHADANSFILFHKGEQLIKDPGNSSYASKEYPGYFFQSPAHNVVLFNGQAQPKDQQYHGSSLPGRLSELMDGGTIKYILSDAVGPTSHTFSRNFRHYLWIGKVILIIDDVKTYENGTFEWLLHPGGATRKAGGDLEITQNNASVLVRPLFPETLVQTGFNHDFPEKMILKELSAPQAKDLTKTETYYSIECPEKVSQTKFITAIILKDSLNDTRLPVIERLHDETMRGVRIKTDGNVTDVYLNLRADGRVMHLNSVNTFGGWDTDAYLMAVTYPETQPNQPSDLFMAYGSYLRRDGKSWFNSLSKLFFIARQQKDHLDLILQGQPLIRASFGLKPRQLTLNHRPAPTTVANGRLTVEISAQP